MYPVAVKYIAQSHWERITIVEPAKHKVSKTRKGENDRLATRYQIMTNKECYESFIDACKFKVREEMKKEVTQIVRMYEKRPDSEEKTAKLKFAEEVLPERFPSLNWFIEQHPPEVKPMNYHTTGLCKVMFQIPCVCLLFIHFLSHLFCTQKYTSPHVINTFETLNMHLYPTSNDAYLS